MEKKISVINGLMKSMFEGDYLLIKHLLSTVFCNGLFRKKRLSLGDELGACFIQGRQNEISIVMELR